ncbi:MAG: FAD-binding protein [Betaproteobacteria bacterium]|nr:FAD-binding protein [Betaproteobacteria bacterium]
MQRKTLGKSGFDVVVVGAGNAAFAAAVAAREAGARVAVLESAPQAMRGGNTRFAGGLFRFTYRDAKDLARVVRNNVSAHAVSR